MPFNAYFTIFNGTKSPNLTTFSGFRAFTTVRNSTNPSIVRNFVFSITLSCTNDTISAFLLLFYTITHEQITKKKVSVW